MIGYGTQPYGGIFEWEAIPSSSESPSNSPSLSPSSSQSPSVSPSISPSLSPSSSQSPSVSPSNSPSLSPSSSKSPSNSPSNSPSLSPSSSKSPSISPSVSPSLSPSSSVSPSPSPGYYAYTRGAVLALPIDDADLATPYTAEDKTKVETDDSIMVAASAESGFALHLFKDHVIITPGCSFTWTGRSNIDASVSSVFLQIYNRQSGAWETLDSDTTTVAGSKLSFYAAVIDLSVYKDENSVVACRVYQADIM